MSKHLVPALLVCAGALLVEGCGGGGGHGGFYSALAPVTSQVTPVTTSTTPVTTSTATARFVYTSDAQNPAVSQFTIDAKTGALVLASVSSPVGQSTTGGQASGVFVLGAEPSGHFLYAMNNQSNDVACFAIDATDGHLSKKHEWNLPQRTPVRATFSPDGRWLVLQTWPSAGNAGGGWLMSLAIDATTGDLTAATELPVADLDNPVRFAFDPSGKFLYGVSSHSDTGIDADKIEYFSFEGSTGVLTPVSKIAGTVAAPKDIVFTASGARAYVLGVDGSVTTCTRDPATGALVAASVVNGLGSSFSIALAPDEKHIYVTETVATPGAIGTPPKDVLVVYSVDASGALVAVGAPTDAGPEPGRVRVDPSGRFAFTADLRSDHVTTFTLDPLTGGVTAKATNTVCQITTALPDGPTSIWLVR